jgi:hypothetical protein
MRIAVWRLVSLAALNACAPQQIGTRDPKTTFELTMSGAIEQTVRARVSTGYAAVVAGGGYSMGMQWPEEHPEKQSIPMSAANGSPAFTWYTDSQPTIGTHLVSGFGGSHRGAIDALMDGPHIDTRWESDSGVLRIATSDRHTGALAGTFDVWMRCKQKCPCTIVEGCQVRVRGSFAVP